tara:strand:- start:37931 stop:38689 length:759 start_codon:yes stop_codon:yes gene_type:complete
MKKNIEIVSLIFKSVQYLHFIYDQLKSDMCKADGWEVGIRIVANDATEEVINELKKLDINYTIFNNLDPNEFYLNRVYKAFNHAVFSSEYDNVCLLNSDNVISKNWLSNLLKHHDGANIPCSRTVESGKMASGKHCINMGNNDFGRHPNGFEFDGWYEFANTIERNEVHTGGIFCSPVFEKSRFIESGGYPEGNVFLETDGTISVGYPNDREVYKTSDTFLFYEKLEKMFGMKHITIFDSIVYHIIEGEKDA